MPKKKVNINDFKLTPKKKLTKKKTTFISSNNIKQKTRRKLMYSNAPLKTQHTKVSELDLYLSQWLNSLNISEQFIKNVREIYSKLKIKYLRQLMLFHKNHNDLKNYMYMNISILVKDTNSNRYISDFENLVRGFKNLDRLRPKLNKDFSVIKDYWSKERKDSWIDENLKFLIKQEGGKFGVHKLKSLTMHQIRTIDSDKLKEIFPSIDNFYINKIIKKLYPDIMIQSLKNLKEEIETKFKKDESKYRVFVIMGHGLSCSMPELKTKFLELKKTRKERADKLQLNDSKYKNLKIVTTQTFGNLSMKMNSIYVDKRFNFKSLYQLLYNFKTKNDIHLVKRFFTLFYYIVYQKEQKFWLDKITPEQNLSKERHNQLFMIEYNYYKKMLKKMYGEEYIINPIKYSQNNIPNNFTLTFNAKTNTDVTGIFELTQDNSDDLYSTFKNIKDETLNYAERLGLFTERYLKTKSQKDIRKETIKYNRELYHKKYNVPKGETAMIKDLNRKTFTLKDAIETIYKMGNIQEDENVLIIYNSCRGIRIREEINTILNTTKLIKPKYKNMGEAIRQVSAKEMMESFE